MDTNLDKAERLSSMVQSGIVTVNNLAVLNPQSIIWESERVVDLVENYPDAECLSL